MKHYKIFVVAIVSAVIAILTTLMGVTGTIIGAVITSVGYNVLVEIFEEPPSIFFKSSRNRSFEWEIVYVFPLVMVAIVQLIMILGFLAKLGFAPFIFYQFYLKIQSITMFNLYRIMGIALIIMACYPYLLKTNAVNKIHGKYILFLGIVFLAKGITDLSFIISRVFSLVFSYLDLPIAIIAFVILLWVIISIFNNKYNDLNLDDLKMIEVHYPRQKQYYQEEPCSQKGLYSQRKHKPRKVNKPIAEREKSFKKNRSFNSSSDKIKFDSRNHYNGCRK